MNVNFLINGVEKRFQTLSENKIALKFESEKTWSYGELNRISNQYAHSLREMGIVKGDRVGILLFNCLEYIALYFAIAKLGAIAVRINFRLSSEELEYILNDSGTKILCYHSSLSEKIEIIKSSIHVKDFIIFEDQDIQLPNWAKPWNILKNSNDEEIMGVSIEKSDPVMLMYTSGTTGRPKGALWSHENTVWFANMQVVKWGFTSQTTAMVTGPLYHVGAMEDILIAVLLVGGTTVITKSGGFNIERVLNVIEKENVSDIFLFPFMIYDMLNLKNLSNFKLNNLKRIFSGGDPVIPWAIEQLNKNYPHIGLIQVYGLTEGTPVAASLDPQDIHLKYHSVGKQMPFTEIKIVDDNGVRQKPLDIGEICIKGPAVSLGYWGKPKETAETFINGWCHTGDLGYFDEAGYLTIAGRKKDMIRSGGENIYAVEIEDILIRHPGIRDVAVIGVPDPKYLEVVCAIIVPVENSGLTEADILSFVENKLANYKKPKKFVFLNELPRTPSGKVQKYKLRADY